MAGIVGLAKALEIAGRDYEKDSRHFRGLRDRLREGLQEAVPGVSFNGEVEGLYTVLNASFAKTDCSESLLFALDQRGICASGGSACSAGAGSHVMLALGQSRRVNVRFSFSKRNTGAEVEGVVRVVSKILSGQGCEG
jgi:cysteine desulfurase